ncbi:MAG TPA: hypothetical protein VKK19_19515 [Candidatus Dormibacteraeota bacterium]|nr:hypothetical protein [Candidatus Dormibacteraeota bacterium]
MGRLAWRSYWALLMCWLLVIVVWSLLRQDLRSGPLPGILVALPPFLIGLDLMVFSRSHEAICRSQVERHRWLELITMGGYSHRTFFVTGIGVLVGSLALAGWIATR